MAGYRRKNEFKRTIYAFVAGILLVSLAAGILGSMSVDTTQQSANNANDIHNTQHTEGSVADADLKQYEADGENISVPIADMQEGLNVYEYNINDVQMQILALKTDDGQIQAAFNTCRTCNGAENAFFVLQGDHLVCQTCGSQFPLEELGTNTRECSPIELKYTVENDMSNIKISELEDNQNLFTILEYSAEE